MGMPDVGLAKGQRPAPVTAAPFFRDEVLPIRTSRWNRPKLLLHGAMVMWKLSSSFCIHLARYWWRLTELKRSSDRVNNSATETLTG